MCSRPAPLGPPRLPRSVPTVTRKVCGGDRGDRVVVAQGRLTVSRTPTQQGIDAVDCLVNLSGLPTPPPLPSSLPEPNQHPQSFNKSTCRHPLSKDAAQTAGAASGPEWSARVAPLYVN